MIWWGIQKQLDKNIDTISTLDVQFSSLEDAVKYIDRLTKRKLKWSKLSFLGDSDFSCHKYGACYTNKRGRIVSYKIEPI